MVKNLILLGVIATVVVGLTIPLPHGNNPSASGSFFVDDGFGEGFSGAFSQSSNTPFTAEEIIALASDGVPNVLDQCIDAALLVCGEGNICWICAYENDTLVCQFACRDGNGECPPPPICGPHPNPPDDND